MTLRSLLLGSFIKNVPTYSTLTFNILKCSHQLAIVLNIRCIY